MFLFALLESCSLANDGASNVKQPMYRNANELSEKNFFVKSAQVSDLNRHNGHRKSISNPEDVKKMHRLQAAPLVLCAILVLIPALTAAESTNNSTSWAEVYFVEPSDGAIVTNPVEVEFGIKGMTLMPAGVEHPESGHHHLLVDLEELPDLDKPIPSDEQHIHFGKAQTETTIELSPGKHTLQLLLGDHLHRPHKKPVYSEKITITVVDDKPEKKSKEKK